MFHSQAHIYKFSYPSKKKKKDTEWEQIVQSDVLICMQWWNIFDETGIVNVFTPLLCKVHQTYLYICFFVSYTFSLLQSLLIYFPY